MPTPVTFELTTVTFATLPVGLEAFSAPVTHVVHEGFGKVYVPGSTPRMVKAPPALSTVLEMLVPWSLLHPPQLLLFSCR